MKFWVLFYTLHTDSDRISTGAFKYCFHLFTAPFFFTCSLFVVIQRQFKFGFFKVLQNLQKNQLSKIGIHIRLHLVVR